MPVSYPVLLGLHLLGVALFLAGVLVTTLALPGLARSGVPRADLRRLRALNRLATTPALVLAWGCGIGMALAAGWFAAGWLQWKLVLVAALTVLHARNLRLLARLAGGRVPARVPGHGMELAAAVLLILVLVLTKPALPALSGIARMRFR